MPGNRWLFCISHIADRLVDVNVVVVLLMSIFCLLKNRNVLELLIQQKNEKIHRPADAE